MNEKEAEGLLHRVLAADFESEVVELLEEAGLWSDRRLWRLYGDKEGNYAQAGNQQSRPEAALVEKLINSVDARLMRKCLLAGIDPESAAAPTSIRAAVARFFQDSKRDDEAAGSLLNWGDKDRNEQARETTLAVTGARPQRGQPKRFPSLTIADLGEGQTPERLPRTILSLNAKNKQRIRFVQGKFNMGGSGALRFCGKQGLQLVLSRRDPSLLKGESRLDDDKWCFTVVRRENPNNEAGTPVHSEFTYLAPINVVVPRTGEVLRFRAPSIRAMPTGNRAYDRMMEWGTVIKLYEYQLSVSSGHSLMKDGLLFALERLLPEVALPLRVHECRHGYEGDEERSFETTLAGLVVRLELGKGKSLEEGFPISAQLKPLGMPMSAKIYAFKEDNAGTYLRDEGVIFTVNGQAHGHLPKSIFSRPRAVGLSRLKDTLLVLVDCSGLDAVSRENLFMTSRDRLSGSRERDATEAEIEELLKNSAALRELQQKRREQDVESALSEDKPLEEVLRKVLRSSPTLKTLFLDGRRLARPFRGSGATKDGEGAGNDAKSVGAFAGKPHPSYFRFKGHDYGKVLRRSCEIDRRCRVTLVTDAENGYFDRAEYRGSYALEILEGSDEKLPSSLLSLESGEAHLTFSLPEGTRVKDRLVVQLSVSDGTLADPFVNVVDVEVHPRVERQGGSQRQKAPKGGGDQKGDGVASGLELPQIVRVRDGDRQWNRLKFTHQTACAVETDPVQIDGEERLQHIFYINLNNESLHTEMKYSKGNQRLLESKFEYGNVLLALGLLEYDKHRSGSETAGTEKSPSNLENGDESASIEDMIRRVTSGVAPVLIPMIDQLAGLTEEDLVEVSERGEDG